MPQKIDSERLSKLAGTAVSITVNDGETLEQAEERVIQENPRVFGGGDVGSLAQPSQMPEEIQYLFDQADMFEPGSTKRARALKEATDAYKRWKESQNEPKPLADRADVKAYLNDIVATNEAYRVLSEVEKAKQGVNTGPWAGKIYDASVPKFSGEGGIEPPGVIDSLISTLAPDKTQKMRMLDAQLKGAYEYAFNKGGKSLTGIEGGATLGPFPSIYDDDEQFMNVLNQKRSSLDGYVNHRVETLKSLGYDEKQIRGAIAEEFRKNNSDGSYLNSVLQSGQKKATHKFNPKTGKVEIIPEQVRIIQ